MTTEEISFIDLFGGIGGFRQGLEQASDRYKCVGYYDNDKYAVQSYNQIFNENYDPTDVAELDTGNIADHNLLCAGFPCPDFSRAQKGEGLEGETGSLFYQIARIARDKKPEILLLENVPGLLESSQGKDFEIVLKTLGRLGYNVEWKNYNSGFKVPQSRERVFILGYRTGRNTEPVLPERRVPRNSPIEIGKVDGINGWDILKRVYSVNGLCPTLTKMEGGNREKFFYDEDTGKVRKITPKECWRLQGFPDKSFEKAEEVNSNTQLYKQAGNAVTVDVVEMIGREVNTVFFSGS